MHNLLAALRKADAARQAETLTQRMPGTGLFVLFRQQPGNEEPHQFVREADGSPARRRAGTMLDRYGYHPPLGRGCRQAAAHTSIQALRLGAVSIVNSERGGEPTSGVTPSKSWSVANRRSLPSLQCASVRFPFASTAAV